MTKSRGNVFADLGFPEPELELMKAKLILRLRELIAEQKLTQTKAAELLGIDQPKISGLLRGRVTGYTLDRLAKLVTRLGQPIDLVFHPMSPSAPRSLPVRKKTKGTIVATLQKSSSATTTTSKRQSSIAHIPKYRYCLAKW